MSDDIPEKPRSLGCARCGDCCDPVGLSGNVIEIIEKFPWYGNPEGSPRQLERLPLRCSYALDAPPNARREGARPLIPITVKGA